VTRVTRVTRGKQAAGPGAPTQETVFGVRVFGGSSSLSGFAFVGRKADNNPFDPPRAPTAAVFCGNPAILQSY